jgi:hypothetical protein
MITGISPTINLEFALILHPIGAVGRTNLYNMVLILTSVILAAIVVAISIIRYHVSFGSFTGSGIAREDIAISGERAKQSKIAGPVKRFLIVVLPDGKVVSPGIAEQL